MKRCHLCRFSCRLSPSAILLCQRDPAEPIITSDHVWCSHFAPGPQALTSPADSGHTGKPAPQGTGRPLPGQANLFQNIDGVLRPVRIRIERYPADAPSESGSESEAAPQVSPYVM